MSPATTIETIRTPAAAEAMGVTFRVLDYWSRTGTLTASAGETTGSGVHRHWTSEDVEVGRVLAILSDLGATREALGPASRSIRHRLASGDRGRIVVTRDGRVGATGHGWTVDLAAM